MRSLLEAAAAQIRRHRTAAGKRALLQVAGFAAISCAFGMWLLPVGIGVAGASLLIMAWLAE